MLVSLLLGAGYNAFVAVGYAPLALTCDDQTADACPYLGADAPEGLASRSGSAAEGGGGAADTAGTSGSVHGRAAAVPDSGHSRSAADGMPNAAASLCASTGSGGSGEGSRRQGRLADELPQVSSCKLTHVIHSQAQVAACKINISNLEEGSAVPATRRIRAQLRLCRAAANRRCPCVTGMEVTQPLKGFLLVVVGH